MKKILFLVIICVGWALSSKAQLPSGSYGPYYFVVDYDHNGEEMNTKSFDSIRLSVLTSGFFGVVSSSLSYTYDFFGQTQRSGTFEYNRVSNGWYVYSFYNFQCLISTDRQRVLITNPHGGMSLYEL